jgi:hypothetical protein
MVGYGTDGTGRLGVRRTVLSLIGLMSAGLLCSCGGSSTDRGEDATGPVAEGDFLQKVADAVCGDLGACCAATGFPYDRAGCESYVLEEIELEVPPNTIWDSVEAGKCIDWFERIVSSCSDTETDNGPCARIFRGTLPEGADCWDSNECADIRGADAICTYDDVTVSGSCTPGVETAHGRAGDECSGTCSGTGCGGFGSPDGSATCYLEDGLICSSSSYTCVAPPALGEPCNDFYCEAGAYCSLFDSICLAAKPNGESCEYDDECTGGSCTDFICRRRSIATSEVCGGQ